MTDTPDLRRLGTCDYAKTLHAQNAWGKNTPCKNWKPAALPELLEKARDHSNFVTDQIHPGPSCTLCGTPMQFKCPSCGSSPAPSPTDNCPFCGKSMTPQGNGVFTCDNPDCGAPQYKRGVTGNEGKEMQNYGSRESSGPCTGTMPLGSASVPSEIIPNVSSVSVQSSAPLASPAVVTPEQFLADWWTEHGGEIFDFMRAQVSELEAQLQQARKTKEGM